MLGPTGVSLTSCVVLEELRVTVLDPKHLVTILGEILPTLANARNLSHIVLDADGRYSGEGDVDEPTWGSLDAMMSEYAEKISVRHPNRRLMLVFRTNERGGAGEDDEWARGLGRRLVLFPKFGDVEYISKH